MSAPFQQPIFISQGGTEYKTNLDNSVARLIERVGQFIVQAKSIVDGGPDLTVHILAGKLATGTGLDATLDITDIAAQDLGGFTAPSVNPRIDLIVLDPATGTATAVTGAEGAVPVRPAIPTDKIPLASILWTVAASSITNTMITDLYVAMQLSGNFALNQLKMGAGGTT